MKNFKFSLERMRSYKNQLLDREKDTLARCRAREREIEAQMRALSGALQEKSHELAERQRQGMDSGELMVYRLYMENGRRSGEQLRQALEEARQASEAQLRVVVAASQEVTSLDKLEDRQREEYRLEEGKEREKILSEFVSSQVIRSRSV